MIELKLPLFYFVVGIIFTLAVEVIVWAVFYLLPKAMALSEVGGKAVNLPMIAVQEEYRSDIFLGGGITIDPTR